jgi:hypothetical protein
MRLLRIYFPWFYYKNYIINSTWRFCDTSPFNTATDSFLTVTVIDIKDGWVKVKRHNSYGTIDTLSLYQLVTLYTIPVDTQND